MAGKHSRYNSISNSMRARHKANRKHIRAIRRILQEFWLVDDDQVQTVSHRVRTLYRRISKNLKWHSDTQGTDWH